MPLYDRAVELHLKLDAARSADTSTELLARGRQFIATLNATSGYLIQAEAFRLDANVAGRPDLDYKKISQSVGVFRGGIARHQAAALQHQPAANLEQVAKAQRDRAARWVAARWKERLADFDALLTRESTESFTGTTSRRVAVQSRAATLRAVKALDPVTDADQLAQTLQGTSVAAWLDRIAQLATELRDGITALDAERDALTPTVRDALARASSTGIPLSDLTDELLASLRAAGVDRDLIVRRQ